MGFPATLARPLTGTHGHITDIVIPPFTGTGFSWDLLTAPGLALITLAVVDINGRAGRTGRT